MIRTALLTLAIGFFISATAGAEVYPVPTTPQYRASILKAISVASKIFFLKEYKVPASKVKCKLHKQVGPDRGQVGYVPECQILVGQTYFECYNDDQALYAQPLEFLKCGYDKKDGSGGANLYIVSMKGQLTEVINKLEVSDLDPETIDRLTQASDDLLNQQREQSWENSHTGHHH